MLYTLTDLLLALAVLALTALGYIASCAHERRRDHRDRDLERSTRTGRYAPFRDYPAGVGPLEMELAAKEHAAPQYPDVAPDLAVKLVGLRHLLGTAVPRIRVGVDFGRPGYLMVEHVDHDGHHREYVPMTELG